VCPFSPPQRVPRGFIAHSGAFLVSSRRVLANASAGGFARPPMRDSGERKKGMKRRDGAQLGASPSTALVRIFKDTERLLIAKVSHAPNSVPFDFAPSGLCPRLPLLSLQSDSLMIQGSRSKLWSVKSRGSRVGIILSRRDAGLDHAPDFHRPIIFGLFASAVPPRLPPRVDGNFPISATLLQPPKLTPWNVLRSILLL